MKLRSGVRAPNGPESLPESLLKAALGALDNGDCLSAGCRGGFGERALIQAPGTHSPPCSHTNYTKYIIDTHDNHVIDPVWELYRTAHQLTGGVSTLLEWDANIPPFPVVHEEVLKAKRFMGEHLEPPAILEKTPEPALVAAGDHSATVFHPLHQILPEVE
jgi:hypothetical protein